MSWDFGWTCTCGRCNDWNEDCDCGLEFECEECRRRSCECKPDAQVYDEENPR